MIGKKAFMDDVVDLSVTLLFCIAIFIVVLSIFVIPARTDASKAAADIDKLNNYYNLNQFLKMNIAENSGKSVAESIITAVENDDNELWGAVFNYAVLQFGKMRPNEGKNAAWGLAVYGKGNRNIIWNTYAAEKIIGTDCFKFNTAPGSYFAADLPSSNSGNSFFVVFVDCKGIEVSEKW